MPKKSKPAQTETLTGDILDLLWTHVVNPVPGGAWLDDALKNSTSAPEPLKTALPAIQRLLATKASREDLGRVARMERYERCFGLLYELDDPGLKSGQLTGLREQLLKPPARGGKEKKFMAVVWEGIGDADDDGERWAKTSPKATAKDEPFGDVDAAVARLLQAGAQPRDLELFTRWQRFDATVAALQVFERAGITESEELLGLHESILGAEPSGKEARPGSWPVAKQPHSTSQKEADPLKPILVVKSVENFSYFPHSKALVLMPKSGNLRIVEFPSGQERAVLETKGRLTGWELSDDGERIFITMEPDRIHTCAATDGKLLHQFKWPQKTRGVMLVKVTGRDQFLVQSVSPDGIQYYGYDCHSPQVGGYVPLREKTGRYRFEWRGDGKAMLAYFASGDDQHLELHSWSWPQLNQMWVARLSCEKPWHVASSDDGAFFAVSFMSGPIFVFDASTGNQIAELKSGDQSSRMAFAPDGKHLVAGEHSGGKIKIWNFRQQIIVRELDTGTGWCFGVCFAPDGETFGAMGHRKALFWRFAPLIEGR